MLRLVRYNLDDYEKALADFEYWSKLWNDEYQEDRINRYDEEAKKASEHLQKVEYYLKSNGIIAYTDDEIAQELLNERYPTAQSRETVTLNGIRYQKRFYPKKRSKSGKTVKEWKTEWVRLVTDI